MTTNIELFSLYLKKMQFKEYTFRPMYLSGGVPIFVFIFGLMKWFPYNALNSEFANLETACIESVPNYCGIVVGFDNLSVLNFEAY
jgi:hypothetical protein